jgi:hypothetical protein
VDSPGSQDTICAAADGLHLPRTVSCGLARQRVRSQVPQVRLGIRAEVPQWCDVVQLGEHLRLSWPGRG